jgi:hypothetical protein
VADDLRDAQLEAAGLHVIVDEAHPELRAECIRVARRIRHSGHQIIGLLPAGNDVAAPPIGVQLGLALAEVSGATIAFVDANLRWPAISKIAGAVDDVAAHDAYATRWLRGTLALLTPARAGAAGAGVPQLARVIQQSTELFAHLLVDLTGFRKLGEHLAAIEMCDGVIVIARAGRTREQQLLAVRYELPARQQMGVLLVG